MASELQYGRFMLSETKNDIAQATRKKVASLLVQHVADGLDLHSQSKHAHWNVRGPHFLSIHKLLDRVAEAVEEHVDEMAYRAVQLGASVPGTIHAAVEISSLRRYPVMAFADALNHLAAVADTLADFGSKIRASIDATSEAGDADTSDLLTGVSRSVDKLLWMTESHLDEKKASFATIGRKSA
jgi:starvation-inducible DNA-binding protein